MKNAFRILVSDPSVEAVLINIFGGIARTDRIAAGVVGALEELGGVELPVVVRLEGTNVEKGRQILRDSQFDFIVARQMADAAEQVVTRRARREVMAIWVDNDTRLLVQGITGKEGGFHALGCRDYGTQVVAGVTPGKGGQDFEGIPVFDSVAEARDRTGVNATMIFVPPPFAADAVMEAVDAGIELVIAITEGIPVNDMLRVKAFMAGKSSRLIGPNCPGVISPGNGEDRHHARTHPPAWQGRGHQPFRHPHVRGGLAADESRARPVHLRRDRR